MNTHRKNFFNSSILYDKYGSLDGDPILVLEDIFLPNSHKELENIYFGSFKIYHLKKLQWEEFPFEEKSFLGDILNRLEEIILFEEKTWSILAEGYSCGLALKLAQENPTKISSVHLLSPIYKEKQDKNPWKYLEDFWFWLQKEPQAIRYFYKGHFLLDFFFKTLSLLELLSKIETNKNVHFWLPLNFPLEKSIKLQQEFSKSEVNRIDKCYDRVSLHNPVFQKIFSWKKISGF